MYFALTHLPVEVLNATGSLELGRRHASPTLSPRNLTHRIHSHHFPFATPPSFAIKTTPFSHSHHPPFVTTPPFSHSHHPPLPSTPSPPPISSFTRRSHHPPNHATSPFAIHTPRLSFKPLPPRLTIHTSPPSAIPCCLCHVLSCLCHASLCLLLFLTCQSKS